MIGWVPTDMLVEIFSDVVCPWCAVGKRRFETALGSFKHADQVDVVWRAYELDPNAPPRREGDYVDRLARKYGMSRERAVAANEQLTAVAAAEGLDFHFERAQSGNTFDAHRLLHYAREAGSGLQDALKERLFVAYFTDGAAIGEPETLLRLAGEVGLDPQECADILAGDRYTDEVRADEREALELGVTGVPFFVVDAKFGIPGAQDADTILAVLERAWTRAHPLEVAAAPADGAICEGDSCAL
jgi:predicted DsbA family dithiol-disulfide isomerase